MNTELKVVNDLLLELQEAEKVNITVDFGGLYSVICC